MARKKKEKKETKETPVVEEKAVEVKKKFIEVTRTKELHDFLVANVGKSFIEMWRLINDKEDQHMLHAQLFQALLDARPELLSLGEFLLGLPKIATAILATKAVTADTARWFGGPERDILEKEVLPLSRLIAKGAVSPRSPRVESMLKRIIPMHSKLPEKMFSRLWMGIACGILEASRTGDIFALGDWFGEAEKHHLYRAIEKTYDLAGISAAL